MTTLPGVSGPADVRRARALATAVIIAAAAAVVALGVAKQPADPPRDLSFSIGVLDEGIWSHNAVNDALFGRARLDDFNPMYVSAGSSLYRISYALFGVGIAETRLPSIALGAAVVVIVGLLWARHDPMAGAVAATLLATTYLYLAYTRLGLLETPAVAVAGGGLACLVVALDRRRGGSLSAAGGALLAVALAIKPQAAAPVAGAAAGLVGWQLITRRPGGWRRLAFGLTGFMAVAAAWGMFVLTHLDPAVRSEWSWHSSGVAPTIGDIPSNIARYVRDSDGFGTNARPILIAAAAGFALQIVALARRRLRPNVVQLAGFGWATASVLTVASLPYTPSRYAVLTLPGLALTAAGGLPAARALVPSRAWRYAGSVLVAGVVAAAVLGVGSWLEWSRHAEFSLRATARLLAQETRPGEVIMGGWGLLPSIDARRHTIIRHEPDINARCPIERFGVDWVVVNLRERADLAFYDDRYPGLRADANRVATSLVLGRTVALFRVPPHTTAVGC